tara:strand:+ start:606 stop:1031 length:426 start_codon:yes stop_codon:yes gene_type:complete
MQNTRFTLLNKLQTKLGDAVTITDEFDELHRQNFYSVSINLGTGFAGNYKGGYWGDCAITNDELKLEFVYGDIYDEGEEHFGEGTVHLDYADGSGLAYTGTLDKRVEEKLEEITGGLITCSGSEQGMQGDDYLSVDIGEFA